MEKSLSSAAAREGGEMLRQKKNIISIKFSLLFLIVLLAMAGVTYALETGDPRLEVWGYVQNETAWHYTTHPPLTFFKDRHVAPGLGNFGHPAAFLINGLSRQNTVEHRDSLMKFENSFNMKILYKILDCENKKLSVFGRIYTLVDSVYDLTNDIGWRAGGLPGARHGEGNPGHYYRNDMHWRTAKRIPREFYVDYNIPQMDLRIGKQMIVWGEIDGFRLLDLVNPFDLREFILDDYEDSRIPQWSVDLKWRFLEDKPDQYLEFIFIPDLEFNQIMKEGSQWVPDELALYYAGNRAFTWVDQYNLFGPGYHYRNLYKEPASTFQNSNFGVRYGGVKQMERGALSYTLSYLYTWDYSWAPFVKGWNLIKNFDSHHAIPGLTDLFLLAPTTLSREYHRMHVFGATFNKVIGKWAFRGEAAYTSGKYVAVNPLMTGSSGQDFESKRNIIDYCLGFDRTVFTDWFLSGQIIQNIVLGDNAHLVKGLSLHERKAINTYFTFVVSKPFKRFNDQAGMSALIAYGTEGEWWMSPKLWWEMTQNIKAVLGAQIFEGQHYQTLGEFKRNSNIYTQIKYSF
jgi:hypothetical protein